jgi:hypothetical protein
VEPGWLPGRLIDGYDFRVPGKPPALDATPICIVEAPSD